MATHDETISKSDFGRLRGLIHTQSGISLSPDKKTMLELRIKKRLRSLNLDSYSAYCDYLFSGHNHREEIVHLIDVVSTNKTDFFREPDHFDFLVQKAVPELMANNTSGRPLLVWSAGCSSGEEPYTLAMVLSQYALTHSGFRFKVLATDISVTILNKAERGVFTLEVLRPVSQELQRRYFMRSRDRTSNLARVVPELRQLIEFRRLNFMDEDFGLPQPADAIFCRNVIIYFDRATQERIMQKLAAQLVPGGFAFVGHSETLHDMNLPLVPIAPALYQKRGSPRA
jgi:chemotaxis protein methyltransferase CheR